MLSARYANITDDAANTANAARMAGMATDVTTKTLDI